MQSVGQKKNKTHRKMPQCYNYKSAQYEVESITKINLNRNSPMIRWGETLVGEFQLAI